MNCAHARKMVYLYRSDELDAAEREGLQNHLRTCSRCAAVANKARQLERPLAPIRKLSPQLGDPDSLTSSIMREIEHFSVPAARPWSRADIPQPWLRIGLGTIGGAVACLLLLLSVQMYTDARKMESLEARLRLASFQPDVNDRNETLINGSLDVVSQARLHLQECRNTPFPAECLSTLTRAAMPLLQKAEEIAPVARSIYSLTQKYGNLIAVLYGGRPHPHRPAAFIAEGERLLNDVEQLLLQGGTSQ